MSYREANADCGGEWAGLERSLIELDEERCLADATVADQDRLKQTEIMSIAIHDQRHWLGAHFTKIKCILRNIYH